MGASVSLDNLFMHALGHLDVSSVYVSLASSECPNLKALLKTLIRKVYQRHQGTDEKDDSLLSSVLKRSKLLDYDLDLLLELEDEVHGDLEAMILVFQDSEAFEASLLAEFIEVLR